MIETIISNFHLEKIWYIVKKHFVICIIIGALGGILAGVYAYMTSTTTYRANISFYVYSDPDYVEDTTVNISNAEFATAKNLVQSYILILKSNTVMEKVIEATDLSISPAALAANIGTSVVSNTAVFYVYVYNNNPYDAAALANAIGEIAPKEIARIVKSGGVEVIDYASVPTAPYSSTNIIQYVAMGFAGGFMLPMVIFLFIGLLDTTIRRRYELRYTFNIPILGDVPYMVAPNRKTTVNKILNDESPFAVKESYGAIRANMLFTGKGERCPVYGITSADQNDGKTLNSINLAISYSQLGKKVLLLDGDMRNISISRKLQIEPKTGLGEYLAGLTPTIEKNAITDKLDVVSGGAVPPNPAELLASKKMEQLLEEEKEQYDCIIIDLPPVGVVTDALLLTNLITSYVLVVRAFQSKMTREKSTVGALEAVDADICGIIFNGLNPKSQDYAYKSYNYDYKYGSSNGKKKKAKKENAE